MEKFRYLFAAFVIAGTIAGCGGAANEEEGDDNIVATTPVTVTNVTNGPVSEMIELNAISMFQKKIPVKATITGYVNDINVSIGSEVGPNKDLFTLMTKEAFALQNSGADTALRFSGIIPIRTQRSGVITTVDHQKGDFVQEGDELAVISDRSSLVFILQVPYEMNAYVKNGSACEIVLDGDSVLKGMIIGALPTVDQASQTQQVMVRANTSKNLPENLIAKVRIIKSTKQNATLVPQASILSDETQTMFWVMKLINDSVAVRVDVKTGIKSDDMCEITEPVFAPSDRIIVTGNYGLADTAKVSINTKK
ncbi:MAG TPA: efflux RND transporter periplasmic adaptor subunit [Bacteroidia bacterium]|nr:efflux RND transporter periplasmic adaptor subunit [Bacteroidia bacterium]